MKIGTMQTTGKGFFAMITVATVCLAAGSAAAQMNVPAPAGGACGCDKQQEVERYVQNVINDYQQRGIGCEESKMYTGACISVYCSSCNDPVAYARCVKTASDYFLYASGYCPQQQAVGHLTAFIPMMPMM